MAINCVVSVVSIKWNVTVIQWRLHIVKSLYHVKATKLEK